MQNNSLLSTLLQYFKKPLIETGFRSRSLFSKCYLLIRVICIAVFSSFLLSFLIAFISTKTNALDQHAVADLVENSNPLFTLFFAALLAPILEETAFRLWHTTKRIPLGFGTGTFVFFYLTSFFPEALSSLSDKLFSQELMLIVTAILVWLGCVFACIGLLYIPKIYTFVKDQLDTHFRLYFYIAAFLFASLHITNYKPSLTVFALMPILILPQFFGGMMLGWLRTNLGIFWSILGHALYNFSLLGPALGLKLLSPEVQKALTNGDPIDYSKLSQSDGLTLTGIGLYLVGLFFTICVINLWLIIEFYWRRGKTKQFILSQQMKN
jgi:Type II CAAX prenyl endopeptidase Rce1-like